MRTLSAFVIAAGLLALPARGYAHPILDEAQQAFAEADFEAALAAYERAEDADDLSRADLVELYVGRALVHHTVGDSEQLELDLFRLATLEPDYDFGRQVPPVIRQAFDRIKQSNSVSGTLTVSVDAARAPGGVRIEARVEGDLAAIVQAVNIAMRTPGNEWTRRTNAPLEFPVTQDQTVEYYVEAVGPGGAVLASEGTPDDPVSNSVPALLNPTPEGGGTVIGGGGGTEEPTSDGLPLWPFLAGGGVVLVAAGVLAFLLLTGENDATNLNCCSFEGP